MTESDMAACDTRGSPARSRHRGGPSPRQPRPRPRSGPAAVAGFTHVKSFGGDRRISPRQQRAHRSVGPRSFRAVVTFQVTYQVGSRNEVTGTTGATHILEHMMFKGSENFNDPKGNSVKQILERVGGQFNATTSFDRTELLRDDRAGKPGRRTSRSRPIACAICGCTKPIGSPK